jgi:hypothetical protein
MELEALCKKLREEKTKLEGMVKSHDDLIMDFGDKYGYNRSDEDEDENDEGDDAAPLLLRHLLLLCHLLLPLR